MLAKCYLVDVGTSAEILSYFTPAAKPSLIHFIKPISHFVMIETIKNRLEELRNSNKVDNQTFRKGNFLYVNGGCQVLSHGSSSWEILVEDRDKEVVVQITCEQKEEGELCAQLTFRKNGKIADWDEYGIAGLLQLSEELKNTEPRKTPVGKAYTREGMMKRVLEERQEKAKSAKYRISFADNIHGEHTLVNEKGESFKITLRDFKRETGYINNPDLKTNKLGTTKHIMFAFKKLLSDPDRMAQMDQVYPFVEIYLDPLNDYRITWHYPHPMRIEIKQLLGRFFKADQTVSDKKAPEFLEFLKEAPKFPEIKIRPEVEEKVQKAWDERMLEQVRKEMSLDFSLLKTTLFPYQKEGVIFATGRSGAIIADDMGLGKTVQAIGAAVMKKALFGFKKTLIVCPASLKEQWKQEIGKFSHEKAVIAEGLPDERADIYRTNKAYFVIVNYETVLRDLHELNRMEPDFIILDEAQRIKNYTTITADTIKRLQRRHALVITGTPLENRLIELYSIVQFIDPDFLGPLWDFSWRHCYFDEINKNKITGHYNLKALKKRLEPILIRREKRNVIKELPNITEINVPITMHPEQEMYHSGFARGIASILRKKFMTPYDHQRLMLLMTNMRMVCDSTYLIDKETYFSPKLHELKYILLEKLDIKQAGTKVIIFSEWISMLHLIGKLLQDMGVGFVRLSGKVAVKHRGKLIEKFEKDPHTKVFLSTEAGGSGLNLQVADTVINFELPWNPAKKNQRLGRIDRIGQKKNKLTVISLITRRSIETKIASGLTLKQTLFDGVLDSESPHDVVDFSAAGKAEFLKQLEESIQGFTEETIPSEELELQDGESLQDGQLQSESKSLKEREALEERETHDIREDMVESEAPEKAKLSDEDEHLREAGTSRDTGTLTLEDVIEEDEPSLPPEPMDLAARKQKAKEAEDVMNKGLDFFNGLFKMSTGSNSGLEDKQMKINTETGEVEIKFKIPGF